MIQVQQSLSGYADNRKFYLILVYFLQETYIDNRVPAAYVGCYVSELTPSNKQAWCWYLINEIVIYKLECFAIFQHNYMFPWFNGLYWLVDWLIFLHHYTWGYKYLFYFICSTHHPTLPHVRYCQISVCWNYTTPIRELVHCMPMCTKKKPTNQTVNLTI